MAKNNKIIVIQCPKCKAVNTPYLQAGHIKCRKCEALLCSIVKPEFKKARAERVEWNDMYNHWERSNRNE